MSLSGVLRRKGAAVAFRNANTGTYDPATDTTSVAAAATVTGRAMQIAGDPVLYEKLELIESSNPTLLFEPDTVGQLPALGSLVAWGAETYAVKNINPLAMNGTATAARIVVGA